MCKQTKIYVMVMSEFWNYRYYIPAVPPYKLFFAFNSLKNNNMTSHFLNSVKLSQKTFIIIKQIENKMIEMRKCPNISLARMLCWV